MHLPSVHSNKIRSNTPSFKTVYFIRRLNDHALVDIQGTAMTHTVEIENPAYDSELHLELTGQGNKYSVPFLVHRELPVTYLTVLRGELVNEKQPWLRVAKFNCHKTAMDFMRDNLMNDRFFKVEKESRIKDVIALESGVPSLSTFTSNGKDWSRRGMVIPNNYFHRQTLRKFHHKQRMIRDQVFAHLRRHGNLNPSRRDVESLLAASL